MVVHRPGLPFQLSPRAQAFVLTVLGMVCAIGVATPATAHAGGVPASQAALSPRTAAPTSSAWVEAGTDAVHEADDHAHASDPVATPPAVSVVVSARFAEATGATGSRPAPRPLSTRRDRGPPAPAGH